MNKYDILFFVGVAMWIGETAYFGFNDKPINGYEKAADIISFFMMGYATIQSWATNKQPLTVIQAPDNGSVTIKRKI